MGDLISSESSLPFDSSVDTAKPVLDRKAGKKRGLTGTFSPFTRAGDQDAYFQLRRAYGIIRRVGNELR